MCNLTLFLIIVEECVLTGREIPPLGAMFGYLLEGDWDLKQPEQNLKARRVDCGRGKGEKKIGHDLNRSVSDFAFWTGVRIILSNGFKLLSIYFSGFCLLSL